MVDSLQSHLAVAVDEMAVGVPYYKEAHSRYLATLDGLDGFLGEVHSIAEVGPSPLTMAFSRAGFDTSVYGLYRSEEEIWRFREAGAAVHKWDLLEDENPSGEEKHDLVLFLEVIEHLPLYPASVLHRVGRLVADDGLLVVSTPDLHRLKNKARILSNRPLFGPFTETSRGRYHIREYSRAEMLSYLHDAGFAPLQTSRFGPFGPSRMAAFLRVLGDVTAMFTTHFYMVCGKRDASTAARRPSA